GNDIERATAMARRMVTQFGMSDVIGPMAVGDSEQEVFLGRELVQRREVSERTAQLVDEQVKKFLDDAYARAKRILEENRDLLEAIAEALLERETLDREDIELLAAGKPLPALITAEGTEAAGAGRLEEGEPVPALGDGGEEEEEGEGAALPASAAREAAAGRLRTAEVKPDSPR